MKSLYSKKTRRKRNNIRKSRPTSSTKKNSNYLRKLKIDEEMSKHMVKQISDKTPIVSMGDGIKLLSKSKKHLRKGKVSNAMASLLTAVAVLSATGPFNRHPNIKEKRMSRNYDGRWTGDPDELMKWHINEQFEPSSKIPTRKKSKTIKNKKSNKSKKRNKTIKGKK